MASVLRWLRGFHRAAVIAQIRAKAMAKGATVEIDIAPDARFGRHFKVAVEGRTTNRVVIGPGCELQDNVMIYLRGGSLRMGPESSLRWGVVLDLSGDLEMGGRNIISYYNVIHCTDRVRIGEMTSTSEMVTIADSRHFHGDLVPFRQNTESAPIEIGRNVWLSTKCSILMGVTIGDEAVVAAQAVVHRDVPAKAIVGGVPAKIIRQR
ncbi:MAG: hypothetical protein QOG03_1222 [Actinomycetota bacterium]|jgi:acetyltransferase-like isoleucine patch superfamily enzyme|nr:hypothetical protein [Actinomycetota bacterium]